MTKRIFICVIGYSVLTLALCLGASAQTTVSILMPEQGAQFTTMEELINEFNQIQDKIRVELSSYTAPASAQRLEKFIVAYGAGTPPDMYWSEYTPMLASNGMVLPIEPFIERTSGAAGRPMIDAATEFHTYGGKLYAMPYGLSADLMVQYNKDLLANGGLAPPDDDWTRETFLDYARRLTIDKSGDATPEQYGWFLYDWWIYMWLVTSGGRMFSMDAADVGYWLPDREKTIETLQFMSDIRNIYGVNGAWAGFPAGTVAMRGEGGYTIPWLKENAPDIDYGVVPWPRTEDRAILTYSLGIHITNTGNAEKEQASWEFINWLTQPKQEAKWALGISLLPSHLDTLQSSFYLDPISQDQPAMQSFVNEVMHYGKSFPSVIGFWDGAWSAAIREFSPVTRGDVSPVEGLERFYAAMRSYYSGVDVPLN